MIKTLKFVIQFNLFYFTCINSFFPQRLVRRAPMTNVKNVPYSMHVQWSFYVNTSVNDDMIFLLQANVILN